MKVYETGSIRNVVLLGHGGAGKTTIAEALAYVTSGINRMGSVDDGNTLSDFDKEEKKRKFSISTSVIPIEYKGESGELKMNILDTPGYFDFVGEVEEAVSAADAAIIVVNGKAGIEPGTVRAWELCEANALPRYGPGSFVKPMLFPDFSLSAIWMMTRLPSDSWFWIWKSSLVSP